jgi:phosphate transport system ATP-binding protein
MYDITIGIMIDQPSILSTRALDLHFGHRQVLKQVTVDFHDKEIIALIGPSGCGKTTLLRSFNRMHDLVPKFSITGKVLFKGEDIYGEHVAVTNLRRNIGMVFQKPNPFPKSIYENISYGLSLIETPSARIPEIVEKSLRESYLWDEVKDDLKKPANRLSGGQQQRLCIARTVALRPEVILMDEPCSALDPISTRKVEDLVLQLKKDYTIVMVTHNMQQARRIADRIGFMYMGEMVEYGTNDDIFLRPTFELTKDYVEGIIG